MKLNFVSFQGVNSDFHSWGMVRIMEPISDQIESLNRYYVSHTPKGYKKFFEVSRFHRIISKLIWALGTRIKLNVGLLRYLQEISYDYHLSRKIQYPCVIVSTAYIPKTAQKNASAGGLNIFIAGNPYDRWINSILINEEKKHKIKIVNAYTYIKRLCFIDKFLMHQHHIVSQSLVTYQSFNNVFKNAKKNLIKYELIPNKILFPDIEIKKRDKFTFIYMASTVWLKGLTYLIEAWKSFGHTEARLIIGGPIYSDVWEIIKHELPKSIAIIGFIPANKLNELYRSCHVCVVPSLADNHPATIAEAMYCNLPVITTSECGSQVLIREGETGFVVPSGDSGALYYKMQWCLQHRGLIVGMGRKSKITVEEIVLDSQILKIAHFIRVNTEKINKQNEDIACW